MAEEDENEPMNPNYKIHNSLSSFHSKQNFEVAGLLNTSVFIIYRVYRLSKIINKLCKKKYI